MTSEKISTMRSKLLQQEEELKLSQLKHRKDSAEIEHLRTVLEKRERNIFDLHQYARQKFPMFFSQVYSAVKFT